MTGATYFIRAGRMLYGHYYYAYVNDVLRLLIRGLPVSKPSIC